MDYKKHYNLLITTRRNMNRKREKNDGYHNHHIIPKSLGGDNSELNLVLLTPKEHFIAHLLLLMIHKNTARHESYRKMVYAFWNMYGRNKTKTKNSRSYQFAIESNKELSIWVKKENEQRFIGSYELEKYILDGWTRGKLPHSKETIESIKNSKSGLIWITKENIQKNIEKIDLEKYISEGWKAGRTLFTKTHKDNIRTGLLGRDLSNSHRKNIGSSLKGKEISPMTDTHKQKLGKPIMFNGIRYDGASWAAKELNTTKLKIFYKLRDKESIDCYYL